ncbi:hypothetical protein CHUAL_003916 [Chamberlinius hualienensis]
MLSTGIKEVVRAFKHNETNPVEICEKALELVKKFKKYNSFITVTPELALRQAHKSLERYRTGSPLSDLDGVPVSIKDNYCVEGTPTTCASKMLENYTAPYTATVVEKLINAGAVIIGKTNMDEFAMGCGSVQSIYGPVRNPWRSYGLKTSTNTADFHVAGGSSGGSAVSVATGTVFGSLGTDTGGSVRNPAALCGVVGLKPTYGLLSRHGVISLVNSMDVPAIHAGCVDDAALFLESMLGQDLRDSTSVSITLNWHQFQSPSVQGIKVGIPVEYHSPHMSPEIVTAWQKIADLLAAEGANVEQISLPHTAYSIACYSVLNSCEVASNFARYDGIEYGHRAEDEKSTENLYATSRHEGFNTVVRERILAGNYFLLKQNYDNYFIRALKVRRLIAEDFNKVFHQGVQCLLCPVTIETAARYSKFTEKSEREQVSLLDYCTQPMNMAGIPAISIPVQLSSEGLPIGLQLVGPMFSEPLLISVAKLIESKVNFSRSHLQKSLN